jgi:hypothetical protein
VGPLPVAAEKRCVRCGASWHAGIHLPRSPHLNSPHDLPGPRLGDTSWSRAPAKAPVRKASAQDLLEQCMKVAAMAMILLIFTAGGSAADDAGRLQTDCAWWTSFDKFNEVGIDPLLPKLAYVAGVYDGLVFGKSQIRDNFAFARYDTMTTALDGFCSDERNNRVPLVPALRVISMDIKGQGKEAIEKETRRLRELARESTP